MGMVGFRVGGDGSELPADGKGEIEAAMRSGVLLLAAILVACNRPLPEEGQPAAELYRLRCGSCHRAYAPSSTRYATWEMILPAMESRMAQAGRPRLTADERRAILEYLQRHAG
jgi:hypothetical protein